MLPLLLAALFSLVIASHGGEAVLQSSSDYVAHLHQTRSQQYNLVHDYSGHDFLDER